MSIVFLAGTAKADITPTFPLPLAGFKHRTEPASTVMHPLYARIAWFRSEGENRTEEALLISADLIWWGPDQVGRLRRKIRQRFGFPEDRVVLHATHTHGSPQTSRSFLSSLGACSDDYVAFLEDRLLAGIEKAGQNLEPVLLSRRSGLCEIGINRRNQQDGAVIMAPNPSGPTDPEVTILLLSRLDGTVKSLFVHYACHPTTTSDNSVSSEFPGMAMELLERHFDNGAQALFLQGCCGDIRPNLAENGAFYRGTDSDVRALGNVLAESVMKALQSKPADVEPCHIASWRTEMALEFQRNENGRWRQGPHVGEEDLAEWNSDPDKDSRHRRLLEMTLLTLAPSLSLLAMNGEMVADYGLYIKQISGGEILPLPYSNGMIGYLPTAAQIEEGGYEAWESALFFKLPAPFDPTVEADIKAGIQRAMAELSRLTIDRKRR